ncbi:potassium channel family protein [Planctomycetaceae bacterium SH139]
MTILGMLLLGLGVWETFMAVLHPRAVRGPVTAMINRGFYHLSHSWPLDLQRVSVFIGPVTVVTQVLGWATLLLTGVSLIVWPELGVGIKSSGDLPTPTGFWDAVYYAGFTLTTLGMGDLVPQTQIIRLLTISASGLGFSFFTLVLTYVMSVYSTLSRRNQFADNIYYRTSRTGDSLLYLEAYLAEQDRSLVSQDLNKLAEQMAELLESHHFYPVLYYFRFNEPRYSMPTILRFCLEVASAFKAIEELQGGNKGAGSEATNRLWHASMQMLEDTKYYLRYSDGEQVPPNTELAERAAHLVPAAENTKSRFVTAFANHQSQWLSVLQALTFCTDIKHTTRPSRRMQ